MLSRFDLVFILLDRVDSRHDELLTIHIQTMKNVRRVECTQTNATTQAPSFSISSIQMNHEENDAPLHERLKLSNQSEFRPLPLELLRKYIRYARKFCFPTVSVAATTELKKFYSEMRTAPRGIDSVPVTTRQLEALIRLTQARARLELAPEATLEHARDVLVILRYTTIDVFSTDHDKLNAIQNIVDIDYSTKVDQYLTVLQQQSKDILTTVELIEIAASFGL